MNEAYDRIVEASQATPSLGDVIKSEALELATFCSRQGDREKTWALFQIAVAHDEDNNNSAINYAKQTTGAFCSDSGYA